MATDPVCGMQVDEASAAARAEFQGATYYFCSEGCHKAFTRQPDQFAPRTAAQPRRDKEEAS